MALKTKILVNKNRSHKTPFLGRESLFFKQHIIMSKRANITSKRDGTESLYIFLTPRSSCVLPQSSLSPCLSLPTTSNNTHYHLLDCIVSIKACFASIMHHLLPPHIGSCLPPDPTLRTTPAFPWHHMHVTQKREYHTQDSLSLLCRTEQRQLPLPFLRCCCIPSSLPLHTREYSIKTKMQKKRKINK